MAAAAPAFPEEPSPTMGRGDILRGNFSQERFLTGFKAPLRSEGTFVLAPEHGLIWRVLSPFPTVTVITPAGLVQKSEDTELVRLSAARAPLLARLYGLLEKSLRGDWQALRAHYDVRTGRNAGKWRVDLRPLGEAGPAAPFESVVIAGDRFAETVALNKAGGDVDRLRFAGQSLSSGPLHPDEASLFAAVRR
jgi:hypothetical protein